MITKQLISPNSVVVVGGSEDVSKPGGATLRNIIQTKFMGDVFVVNPKQDKVQGIKSYRNIQDIPQVECAVIAIAAKFCVQTCEILCKEKGCKAIIILSAGFHEDSKEGAILENKIKNVCDQYKCSLIGPNCIGVLTPQFSGVFTQPIPALTDDGVDIISGSGATALFIMEAAMQFGIPFNRIFSVGNSAQNGVEEILEYLDESYTPSKTGTPRVIMLYIESMNNPNRLYKHASSLIKKGAKICAIKAGYSAAGSRAASSHTGAMASPDKAVNAMFKKCGIIRCYSRQELATVAAALRFPTPKGKRIGIITHAGGPAVMQTDVLSSNGLEIPHFEGPKADALLKKLFPGSAVGNPIDFLATGTAEQLSHVIDACENDFDIDAMTVIFGSPGLFPIFDVYDTIFKKSKTTKKPLYPVFPSFANVKEEIKQYEAKGGIHFPDEVALGEAIVKIVKQPEIPTDFSLPPVDKEMIRNIIDSNDNGYLSPEKVQTLLDATGISRAKEIVVHTKEELLDAASEIGFPIVMKVVGPIHKSDVGGVVLNVADNNTLETEFKRMIHIQDTTGILLQAMLSGTEIFAGAKREDKFGHLILAGLGGIYVEAFHDINSALSPISKIEADDMINNLRSIKLLKGTRGQEGVNIPKFNETIRRISALCEAAPEIFEMDINPLLGNAQQIIAVDARIRIEK
ncbi:MAG: acetate--CoA ligase family protein [Bacteroidales bacterium]